MLFDILDPVYRGREVGITIENYTIDLHAKTKGLKISKISSASSADKNQARLASDISSDSAGDTLNSDIKESDTNQYNAADIQHSLYWSGSQWSCHNCKLKGDKFMMENIPCGRNKR